VIGAPDWRTAMLQISGTERVKPLRRTAPVMTSKKKGAVRSKPSQLDKLILDFRAAHRHVLKAKSNFEAFKTRNPELVKDCEPILVYTAEDGKKVFATTYAHIKSVYPESNDAFSSISKKRREALISELDESYRRLNKERRARGYFRLEHLYCDALYRRDRLFKTICRYQSRTLQEVRKVARIVRSFLPEIAARNQEPSNIYGICYGPGYEEYRSNREDAFEYLASMALALSKVGDR
jgi:hypothetical protein